MGTCVSKCYPCTPSDQTREKLGFASASPRISSSPYSSYAAPRIVPENVPNDTSYANPKIVPRSVPETHHPSPPSSYTSSSSSSSSSMASSTCSSSSTSTTTTNSTCKPFSNVFLESCARNNPSLNLKSPLLCAEDANYNIVVLDPKKRTWEPPKPKPKPTTTTAPPPPPPPRRGPSFPPKRARSSSPSARAGRKSLRAEPPPPPRARKEKSSVERGQSRSRSSKGANADHSDQKERFPNRTHHRTLERGGEALLPQTESFRASPLVEDLNNPLISMDCFIFL